MSNWISVKDRLPTTKCLATYKNDRGLRRIIVAEYILRFTVESYIEDEDNFEWGPDDVTYLLEGWVEQLDNWDQYSSIYVSEGKITHWAPLPSTKHLY